VAGGPALWGFVCAIMNNGEINVWLVGQKSVSMSQKEKNNLKIKNVGGVNFYSLFGFRRPGQCESVFARLRAKSLDQHPTPRKGDRPGLVILT